MHARANHECDNVNIFSMKGGACISQVIPATIYLAKKIKNITKKSRSHTCFFAISTSKNFP